MLINSIGQYLLSTYVPVIGYSLSTLIHMFTLYFDAGSETPKTTFPLLSVASFYAMSIGDTRERKDKGGRGDEFLSGFLSVPVCVTPAKALYLGSYNLFVSSL